MTKDQLRREFIHKRNRILQNEYDELCHQLLDQFTRLDFTGVSCIHMFLPIRKRKEPDTLLIRDWLKAERPEIQIAFPKTNFADHTMQSFADDTDLRLEINAFDIPEPVTGTEINPDVIDLMLVPLLAFDKQGYRVGYGKGFYDRFMTRCKPGTQFVGLCFWGPVDQITDLNQFDQKMTACVTPENNCHF